MCSQESVGEPHNNIITPTELASYQQLKTVDDRERFIARFWAQRDPAPGTGATFRAEFERRVAYADAHFDPNDAPHRGMDTDRGRIYVIFGPPDSTSTFTGGAYEVWRYSHSPLNDVTFKFSLPPISSCDGSYRVYTSRDVMTVRKGSTSVHVHPGRLVTFRVDTDFTDISSIAHQLRTTSGNEVTEGDGAFWDGQLGPAGKDPLSLHVLDCRMFESGGLGFTHPLPPGSYVLSTTVTKVDGSTTREAVRFEVR